jgi:hypothetical protein
MHKNDSLQPNTLSRRQWLEHLTLPALAVAGVALPAIAAQAAPAPTWHANDNLPGARIFIKQKPPGYVGGLF